jgi:hypothetical protein
VEPKSGRLFNMRVKNAAQFDNGSQLIALHRKVIQEIDLKIRNLKI